SIQKREKETTTQQGTKQFAPHDDYVHLLGSLSCPWASGLRRLSYPCDPNQEAVRLPKLGNSSLLFARGDAVSLPSLEGVCKATLANKTLCAVLRMISISRKNDIFLI